MKPVSEMTDTEIDEALAVDVKGWHLDDGLWRDEYGRLLYYDALPVKWHPTTNPDQAIECAESYCYRSVDYFLNCGDMASENRKIASPRAICEAVLRAVRGDEE